MAIEAAKQMAEDRKIVAYEIKNATFHTALNLSSSSDGIETQFYLRPLRNASDKNNQWADFRLCIYENNEWTETCRGSIQVIYETERSQVDNGRETEAELQTVRKIHAEAASYCREVVNADQMYQGLRDVGYHYGPAFKPIVQIQHNGKGEAIGHVALSHPSLKSSKNSIPSCVIHPTTFDGILQSSLVALTQGGSQKVATRIPTRIGRLWVSAAENGLNASHTESVSTYAKIEPRGNRGSQSCISVLSHGDQKLRLRVDDFETTMITSSDSSEEVQSSNLQLCYNVEWKPDVSMLSQRGILDYCQSGNMRGSDPDEYFYNLGRLKSKFIAEALDDMAKHGYEPSTPHLHKYVSWMHLQQKESARLENKHQFSQALDTEMLETFRERIKETSDKQGELFVRTGENLTGILRGEVDALNMLFKDDLMKSYYQQVNARAPGVRRFEKYLDLLAHKNPGMKFLEIGAGTGATTEIVLNALASVNEQGIPSSTRYSQYDFTDISSSFLLPGQEAFKHQKRLNFKVLDIEQDPTEQGFEAQTYDVVVAAHVLHATQSMDQTIQNLSKLLKP